MEPKFKKGDWVIAEVDSPNRAFKIMDVLQGPGEPPRFYYDEEGEAYRANELTLLCLAKNREDGKERP